MQFCGWRAVRATSPQHGQTQWIVRIISSLGLIGWYLPLNDTRHCVAQTYLSIRLRLCESLWNLIGSMRPISLAYRRAATCVGNQGVIACHSGEATISSTGATWESCTWCAMPC